MGGEDGRREEWRDGLTLFCQLTPADLSSRLPITYGAFKVASSRALYCMSIWFQHERGQGIFADFVRSLFKNDKPSRAN